VVSTWISGIPEIVEHGVTGLLVRERSPQAAAAALERLQRDEGLRNALGTAGRERLRKHFDPVESINRLSDLVEDAISNAPGPRSQESGI